MICSNESDFIVLAYSLSIFPIWVFCIAIIQLVLKTFLIIFILE